MFDAENDSPSKAKALNNCANLLRNDPALLSEARELAEQALPIKETFDPVQRKYGRRIRSSPLLRMRRATPAPPTIGARARQSYAAAPISRETLRRHRPLIGAVLRALRESTLEQSLDQRVTTGWTALVAALRAIFDGRRDEDALCESLDHEDSLIVHTILHALDHPDAAREFLEPTG